MTHDAILGFSYDDDGKATIDTTMLRMFAGAKLRRHEPLPETDLDPVYERSPRPSSLRSALSMP